MANHDVRLPPSPCHGCGVVNDVSRGLDSEVPEAGAFDICFYCGALSRFADAVTKVPMTDRDILLLEPEAQADLMGRKARLRSFWKARGFPDGRGKPGDKDKDPTA